MEEAYRVVRSNLLVALQELGGASVMITSSRTGEGKTTTTVGLAKSLAQAGRRVVVVDLDLRHPDVHNKFGLPNLRGVSDVLTSNTSVVDCLQFADAGGRASTRRGLYVLTAGSRVENTAELLGAGRTAQLLDALANEAEIVIVDTAPVLPIADTLSIGRVVAGALLVVAAGETPIGAVETAKNALIRTQTRLFGVILNRFKPRRGAADAGYGYGYGYGYGDERPAEPVAADGDNSRNDVLW